MNIQNVFIKNYKSIEQLSLPVDEINGARAFPYMGINEAGKTSILEAVSLLNAQSPIKVDYKKHIFHGSKGQPIEISFLFDLNKSEINGFLEEIKEDYQIKDTSVFKQALVTVHFDINSTRTLKIGFPDTVSPELTVKPVTYGIVDDKDQVVKENLSYAELQDEELAEGQKTKKIIGEEVGLAEELAEDYKSYVTQFLPRVVLWRSEPKYLITDQVDISKFIESPDSVSIPLKNCFILAGATDVKAKIDYIKDDSNERRDFAEEMSEKVTEHVKSVWKEHDVEIEFEITATTITTSVRDKTKDRKSNRISPSQRSDGFKRMISFILNISAENIQGSLENTILLLDEPETQIHPTGQEYLRDELIKISRNNGNLVMYATHSPYMVDRDHVSRVEHVVKPLGVGKFAKTEIMEIEAGSKTFADINFGILNIVTTDYHNELYGDLHSRYIDEATTQDEEEKRFSITKFDNEYLQVHIKSKKRWTRNTGKVDNVSSATFIRHCIHHPEVAKKNGATYSKEELRASINELKNLKDNPPVSKTQTAPVKPSQKP